MTAGFDYGVPLPWRNSSLWVYTPRRIAAGKKESSLGNFFLGSFGNNYVDNREVKRYREEESFPGFEIGEISARHYAKAMVELNLPPVRFRDIGHGELFPELGAAGIVRRRYGGRRRGREVAQLPDRRSAARLEFHCHVATADHFLDRRRGRISRRTSSGQLKH